MLPNSEKLLDLVESALTHREKNLITKNDTQDIVLDLLEEINDYLDISKIEEKVLIFKRSDVEGLKFVVKILEPLIPNLKPIVINEDLEINPIKEFDSFRKHVTIIDENREKFSGLEVALRVEMALDMELENVLSGLYENQVSLPSTLVDSAESRVRRLDPDEMLKVWTSIKGEFAESRFKEDVHLKMIPGIIDSDFFKIANEEIDLPEKIAYFKLRIRPMLKTHLQKKGQMSFYKGALFCERKAALKAPVENLIVRYKLSRELSSDTLLGPKMHEIALQRDLCCYLAEHGVFSFGKIFGRNEIDLFIDQPTEIFVVEAKRLKTALNQTQLETYLAQLQTYLDQEPTVSRGILALYNFAPQRILAPREWLKNRIWIIAINLANVTASGTRDCLTISAGKDGRAVECTSTASTRKRRTHKSKISKKPRKKTSE